MMYWYQYEEEFTIELDEVIQTKLIGQRLRSLRKRAGFTQEYLSFKSGVNPKYISDIERGKRNPSVFVLLKLAMALDISPLAFLTNNMYEFEHGYVVMESPPAQYATHQPNTTTELE